MKKKIVAILTMLALSASFVACGKSEKLTPAENVSTEASVEASTEASASTEETTEEKTENEGAAEASSEETSTEEASTAESADSEKTEFSSGVVEDNVYKNDYFGYQITAADGYSFVDEATIAQISGLTADALSDNAIVSKALESGTVAIVAYAMDASQINGVNVTMQSQATLTNAVFDEKTILSMSSNQLKTLLESQGAKIDAMDIVEKEVAGDKHYVLKISGSVSEIPLYEQIVCFQKDSYMMTVAATNYTEDNTDALIAGIEKIK